MSASMVMGSGIQTMAANQFSAAAEDVGGKVLFPGDSVSDITAVYLGPDGTAQDVSSGSWTNSSTSQAYTMSGVEGEEGALWLEPAGFVLTVNGGTSKMTGTDGTDSSNHYQPKDESELSGDVSKDIAYYQNGADVTVTADAAQEGKVFDHWEVDSANVSLTDANASETNFTMTDSAVVLTAVYADASTEALTEAAEFPESTEPTESTDPAVVTEPTEGTDPAGTTETTEGGEPTEIGDPAETTGSGDQSSTEPGSDASGIQVIGDGSDESQSGPLSTTFEVTVENGSGSGTYTPGTEVTITADEQEGMTFAGWSANSDSVWFADAYSATTTFSMPSEAVVVTANYTSTETEAVTEAPETQGQDVTEGTTEELTEGETEAQAENGSAPVLPAEIYAVTVENGEGSSQYEVGATVTITANEAAEGMQFSHWEVSNEALELNDPLSPETYFTMPNFDVTVTAVYVQTQSESDEETEAATESETVTETEPITESEAATENETIPQNEEGTESTGNNGAQTPITESEAETQSESTADNGAEIVTEAPETESETQEPEVLDEPETETEAEQDLEAEPATYLVSLSDDVTLTAGAELADKGDGAGSQYYAEAGATVTVTAEEYENLVFTGWNVVRDDTQQEIAVSDLDTDYLSGTFIMPNSSVTVQAVYEELEYNEVQVINGSGSGTYSEGEYVEITANDAPQGQRFKGWTVITGNVELDDSSSAETGFTMPTEAVQVRADYEMIPYTLTVTNGSGSGTYTMGQTVNLTANYPASGKVFAGWVVTSENGSVASADRYYSSMTMPAANVTVEATYKDGPSPDYNRIDGIEQGGEYLRGNTISFTAVGNGMENGNPNPGDYRYRPISYQIGQVTGNWDNSSSGYTISFRITTVGRYTLTVTYAKDVFDGSNWVADGTTDTKSVTFNVVNALSVQTGDNTPIIMVAVIAAVALIVIVILVVVVVRRRRRG